MKKNEVKVGGRYVAKVSDKLTLVRIDRENPHGGWDAVNEKTGKPVRIKSAQRLRSAVRDHAKETAEVLGRGRAAAEAKTVTKAEAVDTAMKAAHAAKKPKEDAPAADGATTLAHGPRSDAAAAKDTKGGKKAPKAAKGGEGKKGMSGLDAAAKVLAEAGAPMNCKAMVEAMLAKGYWKTDGKTPASTIYAAIIRETAKKGKDARFRKTDRGLFELTPARQ
jgi:hypothetical protein